mmetsp:Transcript_31744/g.67548  ORF Transcript_31744/g.67548 Transcript_31744/m.67548 type:complete len:298 (-) Transcript_31744:916-1809(-)
MMALAPMPCASVAAEATMAFVGSSLVGTIVGCIPHPATSGWSAWRGRSADSTTRRCISTHSVGYWPTAVSPLSITASQPSRIAFATSLHSARVGVGLEIMDSSICVATITGFPAARAELIMSFCTKGTSSGFISTPRSPRATITPSDTLRIRSRSCTAEGFSIFARSLGRIPPIEATNSRSSIMSSCFWTKERAIQSTSLRQANSMSARSFGVMGEIASTTSGVFTPFRALSRPPTSTWQSTKGGHSSTELLGRPLGSSRIMSLPCHVHPWARTRIRIFPSSRSSVLLAPNAMRISG